MVTHTVTSHVIHLQALSSKPIGFLRLVGLLGYYIKSGFASTARARARLWQNQQMSFGSDIPDHTMSILLGLGFSVVAPLIAPIGLLYFLVMLLIGKYQMVYVFTESYQSGGKVRCKAIEAKTSVLSLFWVCKSTCERTSPDETYIYDYSLHLYKRTFEDQNCKRSLCS